MRRGTKVTINVENISQAVKDMMSSFQRFNEATVTNWNKESQRVQVKWFGQDPMWFDRDQVAKV